ncbi:hypothetical protein DL96DRAFT_1599740 [Flagelloscypha sp. PMI_526]|nr:hypothetical protein DL96DRAFT_1599740 [Flagelloscypha sp. PMI_526]
MPLLSASLDTFLFSCLLIVLSYVFLVSRHKLPVENPLGNLRSFLTYVLIFHTFYVVYFATVRRPPNLFKALGISVGEPTENIRHLVTRLQMLSGDDPHSLPPTVDGLLKKLGSFEMRLLYVRFGHDVVTMCEYCRGADEFAFFAFPGLLLQYIREIALVGVLTIRGTNREWWRRIALWPVVIVGLVEVWYIATSAIWVPRPNSPNIEQRAEPYMIHDNGFLIRHVFFVIWPLVAPSPLSHPSIALAQMLPALGTTLDTLRHYGVVRAAAHRMPDTRPRTNAFWDSKREHGEWARNDEGVQTTAQGLGLGYLPGGELKETTKVVVGKIFDNLGTKWRERKS